ncbi:MAG: hypothetical protein QNI91_09680 [Arenicellales bacterium]|nr:hypothetical protein [Arenicellales bacterium]
MNEKQKLIQRMLDMQKQFIEFEHEEGLNVKDYFAPSADHPLAKYAGDYAGFANQVVDLAHQEKASKR